MKIYIVISFVVMGLVIFVLSCNNRANWLQDKKFAERIPSYIKDSFYLSAENFNQAIPLPGRK